MEPAIQYSDDELITLWQKGSPIAFDVFYKRKVNSLVKIAIQKTGCIEIAKELVQDVFMDVLQRKGEFDSKKNINGYIYVALRNKIFNYYRRKAVEDKYQDYLSKSNHQGFETTENWLYNKELKQLITSSVDQLPDRCRTVFMLRREANLNNKEISEKLNISINTVEQHMRKALSKLKISLLHYLFLILFLNIY